ncbi:MAG: hypothetical protein IMZ71_02770 [Chloroflexi bacterium]|nr:hypothetical protein [Chloroflexota bacterium]
MSQMRFSYFNYFDDSTVAVWSSELGGLPTVNVQNKSLLKKWKTESGFAIRAGYNDVFSFVDTATDTTRDITVASGTYTGSGLASVLQTAIRTGGRYNGHTVTYNSTAHRFTVAIGATATTLRLHFGQRLLRSMARIIGFLGSDYTGTSTYVSQKPTQGNEHFVTFSGSSRYCGTVLVFDAHNLKSGTVLMLRTHNSSTYFDGIGARSRGGGIFQSSTNRVGSPEDLTAWTASNAVSYLPRVYALGKRLTRVTRSASPGRMRRLMSGLSGAAESFQCIVKKGVGTDTKVEWFDASASAVRGSMAIDFTAKTVTAGDGLTNLIAEWLDADTVICRGTANTITAGNNNYIRCTAPTTNGQYCYFGAAMGETKTYPTEYTASSRAADTGHVETVELPTKFCIKVKLFPQFTTGDGTREIATWRVSAEAYLTLYYDSATTQFVLGFKERGSAQTSLVSQAFGGAEVINRAIVLWASVDLTGGGTGGSRLICIATTTAEDTTWSDACPAKTTAFDQLTIGRYNASKYLDAHIQEVKVWAGTYTAALTTEAGIDTAMAAKTSLLNRSYLDTGYMVYLGEHATLGHTDLAVTLKTTRKVHYISGSIAAKAVQLSWWDGDQAYTEFGRLWLGKYIKQQFHVDAANEASYRTRRQGNQSKVTMSRAGVSFIDAVDNVREWDIPLDLQDPDFNAQTQDDIDLMLETVRDSGVLYISLVGSDETSTVYGYFVGDFEWTRLRNTKVLQPKALTFREQK